MKIITKTTRKGGTSLSHIIFEENPHQQSLASYILLREELKEQDEDFLNDNNDLFIWLDFREAYLNKVLQEKGELTCRYCGKTHLEIGGKTIQDLAINNKNPNLATIDHIVALSEGGPKYDEKNMCVACKKCNREKGNKSEKDFIQKKMCKY